MCGIVGAFSFNDFPITEEYLTPMRDAMWHRGPDGAGIWINKEKNIGLGHRRLVIIDLSDAAAQPMASADQRFWITFNGEIYNHAALRRELQELGHHQWKTDHSDTEVILHAFQEWGIDCLQKFRGMFAFAIWDEQQKALFLARDRIGIKPLYYCFVQQRFIFASEIKALLKDRDVPRAVNHQAFYHYLSFLTTPAPETLFEGIYKLEPGTWMRIDNQGNILKERYWDVWDFVTPMTDLSEQQISETILAELRDSVKLHKESDVPMGVFLSGGIDSSTNAALFSENNSNPVQTFSIGYQGKYQSYKNELDYAKMMADSIGAQYYQRLLTVEDLLDFLPQMIRLQDEPIADPVCVPVYYVSKLAKDNGVKVCQVGEGADELFWGYPSWKIQLQLQQLADTRSLNTVKKMSFNAARALNKQHRLEFELLRRSVSGQPVFWGGAFAFTEFEKQSLLSPRLRQEFRDFSSWQAIEPIWNRYQQKCWDPSNKLNWMSYLDLNFRLPELLLMRVDKMSMGVSLEGRVPFLDHRFVEMAMSIPASLKTKHGTLKYLLKKSVRGLIPDELIDRKKQGFGVPINEWLFDKLGDYTKQVLNDFCRKTDFFDSVAVNSLLQKGNNPKIWYLLNFALWWQEYIEGK